MAEPTVQVLVSLIDDAMVERAARALFEGADGISPGDYSWEDVLREDKGRADLWRADARAVLVAALAQPTPTAEPRTYEAGWNEGHTVGFDDGWGAGAAATRGPAAPPSITDMVPNERFCMNSAQHSTHLWFPAPFDSAFGDVHYTCPGRIDPSTIRDVTLPAGA